MCFNRIEFVSTVSNSYQPLWFSNNLVTDHRYQIINQHCQETTYLRIINIGKVMIQIEKQSPIIQMSYREHTNNILEHCTERKEYCNFRRQYYWKNNQKIILKIHQRGCILSLVQRIVNTI